MTRNTFTSRLTHIFQLQTQYGRLWLRSRFRRLTLPPALKVVIFAVTGMMVIALTGTLLLLLDLITIVFRMFKRPFPRGNFRQVPLIRKPT